MDETALMPREMVQSPESIVLWLCYGSATDNDGLLSILRSIAIASYNCKAESMLHCWGGRAAG